MNTILAPIEWVVSWIMVQFHSLFTTLGMNPDGGWAWALSIVGLVIVIRIILIPLFVKQIKSQRGLQQLQPKIKELQAKYKDDREKQSQELMKLYKETGTNPLASCFPILIQSPIFFALFRVLNGAAHGKALGVLTAAQVESAANATIFGAPISATFVKAGQTSSPLAVHVVAAVMIVLMSASMFYTQRQLMTKNMPATSQTGPFAQQQKIMLYLFPLIFLISGINFPIGVLIYWLTTNVWSMGQQLYVINRMPAIGSEAEKRLEARKAAKASKARPLPGDGGASVPGAAASPGGAPASPAPGGGAQRGPAGPGRGQRQQPKRQPRGKRQS
ncbi:MAG: membrane protein insertase YidC [Motilibacteraceae bacterium]